MIGRNDLNWKKDKLYRGKVDTGFAVHPAEDDVWWVRWPDGKLSADYYNRVRAKDHAARLYFNNQNTVPSEPAGAFK